MSTRTRDESMGHVSVSPLEFQNRFLKASPREVRRTSAACHGSTVHTQVPGVVAGESERAREKKEKKKKHENCSHVNVAPLLPSLYPFVPGNTMTAAL